MTAVALALHIFGAVVWVGGMFAIYVCLRPALGMLEPPQRLRLMRVTFEKFFPWVWLAASSGREANEVSATGLTAGASSEGAAGSTVESISKLVCTIDPNEIMKKAGGSAECTFETGH